MQKIMTQSWLDVDYCDVCGVEIKNCEEIYLDIKREHAGVIPAYCLKCAEKPTPYTGGKEEVKQT